MAPKRKQKSNKSSTQSTQAPVIPIEQLLTSSTSDNPIVQILRSLEQTFEQSPQVVSKSFEVMLLRICGFSGLIPKLDIAHLKQSFDEIMKQENTKVNHIAPLIVSYKNPAYKEFKTRLQTLLKKLVCQQFEFMKKKQHKRFLESMRSWITILSRSKYRYVRMSSLQFLKYLMESEGQHYIYLQDTKKSKPAKELLYEIEPFFQQIIFQSMVDVDNQIRSKIFELVKDMSLVFEKELFGEKMLTAMFEPVINAKENNTRNFQNYLSLLHSILMKGKSILQPLSTLHLPISTRLSQLCHLPFRIGLQSLKILIEFSKCQHNPVPLSPTTIISVFENYVSSSFEPGIQIAIEAFYESLYSDQSMFIEKRKVVLTEIMNLLNMFENQIMEDSVLKHVFEYRKVGPQHIFVVQEMFGMLMEGTSINGEALSSGLVKILLKIIVGFAKYIEAKVEKYSTLKSQRHQAQKQKWFNLSLNYNTEVLTNMKQIICQKLTSSTTKNYLSLLNNIFLPISGSLYHQLPFILEHLVIIFEDDHSTDILKQVVNSIYYIDPTKCKNIVGCVLKRNDEKSRVGNVFKKIAIISKFFVEEFTKNDSLDEVIKLFKYVENQKEKIELLNSLFSFIQWNLQNIIMRAEFTEGQIYQYHQILGSSMDFLFHLLTQNDAQISMRIYICNLIVEILKVVSGDTLKDADQLFYTVSEDKFTILSKFLCNQLSLPFFESQNPNSSFDSLDLKTMMNNFSLQPGASYSDLVINLFELFAQSSRIAKNPLSIKIIIGALLHQEDDIADLTKQITLNRTNDSIIQNYFKEQHLFNRQKLSSKFLNNLVHLQSLVQNKNKFIFWQFFEKVLHQLPKSTNFSQKIISRMIDIYIKKKSIKQRASSLVNKSVFFIVKQIDDMFEYKNFEISSNLITILMKMAKKFKRDTLQRLTLHVKNHSRSVDDKDVDNFLNFMAKISKANIKKTDEEDKDETVVENDEQNQNEEEEEFEQQKMVRPAENRRATRSMRKETH